MDLVHTILFRHLRRTLPATNLAVRQVGIQSCHLPLSVCPPLTVGRPLPHLEAQSVELSFAFVSLLTRLHVTGRSM